MGISANDVIPLSHARANFSELAEEVKAGAEKIVTKNGESYIALIDELLDTVIPNLERFPGMGRPFLAGAAGSVETTNSSAALRAKLLALTVAEEVRLPHLLTQPPFRP